MTWQGRRKHALDKVREYLIEKYDTSPDGKLQKLINALWFELMYGPLPVADVREEIGAFYPGWFLGCSILQEFLDEMPRTLWIDLEGDDYISETGPEQFSKCEACNGAGCDDCDQEGYFENYMEGWWEINVRDALLRELKGYEGPRDPAAAEHITKYWHLPDWKVRLPDWKLRRVEATERNMERIKKRQSQWPRPIHMRRALPGAHHGKETK